MHQQQRHGLSHDVAAPDDDGVRSLKRDAAARKISIAPAGVQATSPGAAGNQPPQIHRMKSVHVLRRVHGFEHALGVHLRGERKLHEDSVHIVARVEFRNQREHFLGRNRRGRRVQPASKAQLLARRDFAAHVNLRRGVFSHQHRSQAGTNSGRAQSSNFLLEFGVNLIPNRVAVEDARRHDGS